MKDIAKVKDSTIYDNPTDTMDIEGEKTKDKIDEHSTRYTRRKDARYTPG